MPEHPLAVTDANDELIQRLYAAFAKHDGKAMASCYAPDAHFSDPVFVDLRGREPGAMWTMLTGRAEDLTVELREHDADGDTGHAHWIANYTFTQTGRKVHNDVRAAFRFRDGLIVDHVDTFDFPRWARQALGTTGLLLGWTPMVRNKVRAQARAGLDKFLASND
jgi:ketosteroid isomerase-like protein